MTTQYHAKVWAHLLTLQGGQAGAGRLARSLAAARVDLNPHQVGAAVFALRSPLHRGVLLADEVGLGKTIEAGLVIAQRWAEGRRRILIIVPAMLRKQWQAELADKFQLPSIVVDTSTLASRGTRPGAVLGGGDAIVICSYQFAAKQAVAVSKVHWDLAVLDEAHRMRGVARGAVMATAVVQAIADAPRLLLTATPLQNSLMELYGLVQVVDPHVFGDVESFKAQFVKAPSETIRNALLRERIQHVCIRTLRRQVQEYVRFTRRISHTQTFEPGEEEHQLYLDVSEYLRRDRLVAMPSGQRALLTMVLRKLLASSTFAIAATLLKLVDRVAAQLPDSAAIPDDFEVLEGVAEDWSDLSVQPAACAAASPSATQDRNAPMTASEVQEELALLRSLAQRATRIAHNAKGTALLTALGTAFRSTAELGGARKAVVFTESKQTQTYLRRLLEADGYTGEVATINGSNADPASQAIWQAWKAKHKDDGVVSGVKSADVRAAIIEHFRDHASVLLATEAAAEGVNLQFCSLVVNYDLPWNPQRVEQRIGRCHRYGQAHDVVVVNFLNLRNAADQRVLDLLTEKFLLFDGVFGASDEILGALGQGVDLERRIAEIYQTCRTADEIHAEFDRLQEELRPLIEHKMAETREQILSTFDADVQERLRVHRDQAKAALDARQRWLLDLAKAELDGDAQFDPATPSFVYEGGLAHVGSYQFDWHEAERTGAAFFHADHALARQIILRAAARDLVPAVLVLRLPQHGRIARLEPYAGRSGWLAVQRLTISGARTDEFVLTAAVADDGEVLSAELASRFWELDGEVGAMAAASEAPAAALAAALDVQARQHQQQVRRDHARLLEEEADKLSRWADDQKLALRMEIEDLDTRIREVQREVRVVESLEDKLRLRRQERDFDRQRTEKRRAMFEAQDAVDIQRERLLDEMEAALQDSKMTTLLFQARWVVAGGSCESLTT